MQPDAAAAALALIVTSIALVTDVRDGKVYNWLTLPVLLATPLLRLAAHGWSGLTSALLGVLMVVGILLAVTVLIGPGLGGGDLKLLMALGAVMGWPQAGWLLVFSALAGLPLALWMMIRHHCVRVTFRNLTLNLLRRAMGERRLALSEGSAGPRLPYAVAIFCGTVATVVKGFLS